MLQKSCVLALAAAICWAPVGCSKSDPTAKLSPEDDSEPTTTNSTDINSVNAISGEGNGLSSPAKQPTAPSVDPSTDPTTVTSKYLGFLREADSNADGLIAANNLLTTEAREATREANVDVSPARVDQLEIPGPSSQVCHQ